MRTGGRVWMSDLTNARYASIAEFAATSRGFAAGASKMSGEATPPTNATFATTTAFDDLHIHLRTAPRRLSNHPTVRAVNETLDAVPLRLDVVTCHLFVPPRTAPTTSRKTRCCSLWRGNCIVRTGYNSSGSSLEHITCNCGRNFFASIS